MAMVTSGIFLKAIAHLAVLRGDLQIIGRKLPQRTVFLSEEDKSLLLQLAAQMKKELAQVESLLNASPNVVAKVEPPVPPAATAEATAPGHPKWLVETATDQGINLTAIGVEHGKNGDGLKPIEQPMIDRGQICQELMGITINDL